MMTRTIAWLGEGGKSPSAESSKRPADQAGEESAKKRERNGQSEGVHQSRPSLDLSQTLSCPRAVVTGVEPLWRTDNLTSSRQLQSHLYTPTQGFTSVVIISQLLPSCKMTPQMLNLFSNYFVHIGLSTVRMVVSSSEHNLPSNVRLPNLVLLHQACQEKNFANSYSSITGVSPMRFQSEPPSHSSCLP